jgi:pyruvate dehydrogenase E2 component (dihydrolipoamide acetyltransferase)
VQEPSAAERTVARRAAEARATVPNLELAVEVTLEAAPSTALLVRACALALAEHHRANAAYRDGRFELYSRVNVGVVVASEEIYLIPTVFDADRKSLDELSGELDELTAGAREGRLASPAFTGATFTFWDAGAHGISAASIPPVPPQAGALAAGALRGAVATLTLACDHRILYGDAAARFLGDVKARLERGDP